MEYKKAIATVTIAVIIVLISVGAVISYDNWFKYFLTGFLVKLEQRGDLSPLNSGIEGVASGDLYFINGFSSITILDIKVGPNDCNYVPDTYGKGLLYMDISTCIDNLSTDLTYDVVIVTDQKVFSRNLPIR